MVVGASLEKSTSMMGRRGSLNNDALIGRRCQDLGHGRSKEPGFSSPYDFSTVTSGIKHGQVE